MENLGVVKNYALELNLTGIRLLQLFSALLESPKTFEEINEYFLCNKFLKTKYSNDTLRNDLNALRSAGCEISRADRSTNYHYILKKHPFSLQVSDSVVSSLKKMYYNYLYLFSIDEILSWDVFLKTIASHCESKIKKENLLGISILKSVDSELFKSLTDAVKKKKQINLLYHSNARGDLEIEILCDKFTIRNRKLYIAGYDFLHNAYSYLLVKKVKKIFSTSIRKEKIKMESTKAILELSDTKESELILDSDEEIIKSEEDKITLSIKVFNKFFLKQKILEYGSGCKIIEPQEIKDQVLEELKIMKEIYEKN